MGNPLTGGALEAVVFACARSGAGPFGRGAMYLARLRAENFRIFGAAAREDEGSGESLDVSFNPGTNVLVGENDAGKLRSSTQFACVCRPRRRTSTG